MDDLRQNIKKKQEAKQTEHETKKTEDLRIKVSNTAAMKATVKQANSVGEINKKSTLSDVSAEEVNINFYIIIHPRNLCKNNQQNNTIKLILSLKLLLYKTIMRVIKGRRK